MILDIGQRSIETNCRNQKSLGMQLGTIIGELVESHSQCKNDYLQRFRFQSQFGFAVFQSGIAIIISIMHETHKKTIKEIF